eukprot:2230150-Rhodomonas_salina.1
MGGGLISEHHGTPQAGCNGHKMVHRPQTHRKGGCGADDSARVPDTEEKSETEGCKEVQTRAKRGGEGSDTHMPRNRKQETGIS